MWLKRNQKNNCYRRIKKMSAISKDGYEQIKVIKAALDSMYDKLNSTVYTKVKPTKNEDVNYKSTNLFNSVKSEFEAIAGIVDQASTWSEV
jgi:Flp pilus assembly pilin Flp